MWTNTMDATYWMWFVLFATWQWLVSMAPRMRRARTMRGSVTTGQRVPDGEGAGILALWPRMSERVMSGKVAFCRPRLNYKPPF